MELPFRFISNFSECRGVLFLNNHVCVKTVHLCRWGTKTVPLGEPNYGQPNSVPRGIVLAPFFLSEGAFAETQGSNSDI